MSIPTLFNEKVKCNPLKTKADMQNAVSHLCEPLRPFMQEQKAGHLFLGTSGSVYNEDKRGVEGFLRCLWGIAPLTAGGGDSGLFELFKQGIIAGTDPNHKSYWGTITSYDQLMVEMASIALTLMLLKNHLWDQLTSQEQENLYQWLAQINLHDMPKTNWLFFRVLVNIAFKKCGREWSEELLADALERVDTYYLGDGWYFDGYKDQIDYYTPFAMHYYSLVYAQVMGAEDPERAAKYKERAALYAQTFKEWFSTDGSALPFGRSLTYRFAQSSFWSALAFANVEALPWGVIKGIVLRNLRYWFSKPIFDSAGLLSIGYEYQNLNMAEGYNAPGSPYWAFKTFLVLALPDEHPFWTAEEQELVFTEKSIQPHPRMIICHDTLGKEVQAFTSGQHAHEHAHADAKYEKFVYSTTFGFSVPKGNLQLKQGAFDSCLALAEGDGHYRSRYGCESYNINEDYIECLWKPWGNVEVKTFLIALTPWHVRIHIIKTERILNTAEGGFSIAADAGDTYIDHDKIFVKGDCAVSGIIDCNGNREAQLITPEPNTNLKFSRTVLPTLISQIGVGTHILVSSVLGTGNPIDHDPWEDAPVVIMREGVVTISQANGKIIKIVIV